MPAPDDQAFLKVVKEVLAANKKNKKKPCYQTDLANEVGISDSEISKVLSGERALIAKTRNALARALERHDWIVPEKPNPNPLPSYRRVAVLMVDLRARSPRNAKATHELRALLQQNAAEVIVRHQGFLICTLPNGTIEFHFGKDDVLEQPARIAANAAREFHKVFAEQEQDHGVCAVVHVANVEVGPDNSFKDPGVRATCEDILKSIEIPGVFASPEAGRDLLGYFRYDPIDRDDKLIAFAVGAPTGARNPFEAAELRGQLLPFIGRDPEMSLLRDCWSHANTTHFHDDIGNSGSVVLVHGSGGQGKSRLLYQIRNEIEPFGLHRPTVPRILAAAAYEDKKIDAWYPIRVLLGTMCGFVEDDPSQVKATRLASVVETMKASLPTGLADSMIPRLTETLFGFIPEGYAACEASSGVLTRLCQEDLVKLFIARSRQNPMVVVVDDIQWADSLSLETLRRLSSRAKSGKLVLVIALREAPTGTALPIELSKATGWEIEHTLNLVRFHKSLVKELAQRSEKTLTDEEVSTIYTVSNGVPFYVTLLVQADDLQTAIEANDPLLIVHLTRFSRLPESARKVAEIASALGQKFPVDLLARLSGLDKSLESELEQLKTGGIIYEVDWKEWAFVHFFMKKAIYESIPENDRVALHGRVVDRLQSDNSEIQPDPSILARHLEPAGRLEEAIQALKAAGLKHLAQWALPESIDDYERALRINVRLDGPEQRSRELDLRLALGAPLMARHGYSSPDLKSNYERAAVLADDPGTSADRKFEVRRVLWVIAHTVGLHQDANRLVQECERLVNPEPGSNIAPVTDPGYRVERYLIRGFTHIYRGRYSDAWEALRLGVQQYHEHPYGDETIARYSQDPLILCQARMALASWLLGEADRAVSEAEVALARSRKLKHDLSHVVALVYFAWIHHCREEPKEALAMADEAIQIGRLKGFVFWTTEAEFIAGWAHARLGDVQSGIAEMEEASKVWKSIGAKIFSPYLNTLLIEAKADYLRSTSPPPDQDELKSLERAITEELIDSRRIGEGLLRPLIHAIKARIRRPLQETETSSRQLAGRLRLAIRKAKRQGSPALERKISAWF